MAATSPASSCSPVTSLKCPCVVLLVSRSTCPGTCVILRLSLSRSSYLETLLGRKLFTFTVAIRPRSSVFRFVIHTQPVLFILLPSLWSRVSQWCFISFPLIHSFTSNLILFMWGSTTISASVIFLPSCCCCYSAATRSCIILVLPCDPPTPGDPRVVYTCCCDPPPPPQSA